MEFRFFLSFYLKYIPIWNANQFRSHFSPCDYIIIIVFFFWVAHTPIIYMQGPGPAVVIEWFSIVSASAFASCNFRRFVLRAPFTCLSPCQLIFDPWADEDLLLHRPSAFCRRREITLQWCDAGRGWIGSWVQQPRSSSRSSRSTSTTEREISCSLWLPYAPCLALHWLRSVVVVFSLAGPSVYVFVAFSGFLQLQLHQTDANRYKCLFYFALVYLCWLIFLGDDGDGNDWDGCDGG